MDEVIETIEKNATEIIRVGITEYNGHDLAYLRVFFHSRNAPEHDPFLPSKKGITVSVKMLPLLISALQKTEGAALKAGLLDKGPGASKRGGYRPGAGRKKSETAKPLADVTTNDVGVGDSGL
jgi:hypothetical protein